MSTSHHTPYPFGGPLTSAAMNAPLGQLDAAIGTVIASGSGTATTLTAQALAGQASLTVASSAGFTAGDPIYIGTGTAFESRIVATVPGGGVTITVTVNLTNTYAIGRPVSKSPVEIVAARGGYTTLGGRIGAIEGRVFDVKTYLATGDGTTDDWAAIQAAINAANAAGGGTVYFPHGTYKVSAVLDTYAEVHLVGESSRNTTLLSGALTGIIRIIGSSAVAGTWKATQFEKLQFKNGSTGPGTQIMVDVQFVESEIVFEDCRWDGAGHGCQGVRLSNAWGATFSRCYFAVFPSTTLPCTELASTGFSPPAGHPIHAIAFRDCGWSAVLYSVKVSNTGPVHGLVFDNCAFGPGSGNYTGSVGIDISTGNQLWGGRIVGCKFEDVERPMILRGFNWHVEEVYIDHALTGIAVEGGGGYRIDRIAFSGAAGNEVGIGVHVKAAVTGQVDVGVLTQVSGLILTTSIFQNDAGLLGEDAMVAGDYGASVAAALVIGAANRALYVPITVRRQTRINGMRVYVGTASGNVSAGIYDSAGARLSTSGAVACPASFRATIAFPVVYLNPGIYYLALSADNNTATFGMSSASAAIHLGGARYQETAHPIPATATFAGETAAMLAVFARVAGSYIA